jgi:polysaccharide export outer membrane protein
MGPRILVLLALALLLTEPARAVLLSPADRLRITVQDAEELSGDYIVRPDGTISFNEFGPVPAAGTDEMALSARLETLLRRYLKRPVVSVRLQAAGPINVTVTGAVYRPGPLILSGVNSAAAAPMAAPVGTGVSPVGLDGLGDLGPARTVAAAIKAAGGILPNAELGTVTLTRDGRTRRLDLRSSLEQSDPTLPADGANEPLLAGDRIHVPRGKRYLSAALFRSQLAPDQIQVTVSGAPKAGVIVLPSGSRLVDALTAAGATGGSFLGVGRWLVLSRIDPVSAEPVQARLGLDAAVEGENPLLLQGDAIYVYDGPLSNFFDTIGRVLPVAWFINLFR